ncbi:hypothetical protein CsSME_00034214 [Camellia sinensis var. sinensis]
MVKIRVSTAAQEALVAERDQLSERLVRADEEKQRALQMTKARYIFELRKLRDAHKAEVDKKVEDAEDHRYVEGERTYEQQVQDYASAAQKKLIEEVKKAAEEEVTTVQPGKQNPSEAFEGAEDREAEQEVVAVVDAATNEADEGMTERDSLVDLD